ncbi:exonuclease V-like [Ptychodera flava]|uniref:exonuclease V-like n=1 Tax=Ptychodera flava TaxID=63121 RepID=UPI00396A025E
MASPTKRSRNSANESHGWTMRQVKSTQFSASSSQKTRDMKVKNASQQSNLETFFKKCGKLTVSEDQRTRESDKSNREDESKPELQNTGKSERDIDNSMQIAESAGCVSDETNKATSSVTFIDNEKVRHREKKEEMPLWKFKWGRLCVTDITAQHWCEQQLLYTFTIPTVPVENIPMTVGSSMHLARELEVHDVVPVSVSSKEDAWAIKLLNMIDGVSGISFGVPCIREMPIFGEPYGKGIFVVGVIDELRYSEKGEFQLCEFKSRASSRTLPRKAQRKNHALQVMIYKQLFDELVKGLLKKETILRHVKLKDNKLLSEEVLMHLRKSGITSKTFGELLDIALLKFQFSDLPCIDSLIIEYSFQGDCKSFASDKVGFDADWLNSRLDHYFSFWRGDREVEGVDIEDAWKCHSCDFSDICEWKKEKEQECLTKNKT